MICSKDIFRLGYWYHNNFSLNFFQLIMLPIKSCGSSIGQTHESSHWPNTRAMSQSVIHHKVMSVFPLWKLLFLEFLTWLTTYVPMHFALFNGKWLSLQQETKLLGEGGLGFPVGCCDHNTLSTIKFGHFRVPFNRAHRSLFWLADYNERRRWWHLNSLSLYAQSITNWKK